MQHVARTMASAVVVALLFTAGVVGGLDGAGAQTVCVPGVYSCPPDTPGKPPDNPPPPPPRVADQAPARGALSTTGTDVAFLLGLALLLLVSGRVLVWAGRRHRRRARRLAARRVRRALALRREARPLPGLWSLRA